MAMTYVKADNGEMRDIIRTDIKGVPIRISYIMNDNRQIDACSYIFTEYTIPKEIIKAKVNAVSVKEVTDDMSQYPEPMQSMKVTEIKHSFFDRICADDNMLNCMLEECSGVIDAYIEWVKKEDHNIPDFKGDAKDITVVDDNGNEFFDYDELLNAIMDELDIDEDMIVDYLNDYYGDEDMVLDAFGQKILVDFDTVLSIYKENGRIYDYEGDTREWIRENASVLNVFEMCTDELLQRFEPGDLLDVDFPCLDWVPHLPNYRVMFNRGFCNENLFPKTSGFIKRPTIEEKRKELFDALMDGLNNISVEKVDRLVKLLKEE